MLHTIHFTASIDQATANHLQNVTLSAVSQGATAIDYYISTDGGSTSYGASIYNMIRSPPIPVTMHNIGNVESMGDILFLAADRRIAAPHSRFLIHSLHWGFGDGTVDHARLTEHVASLDNDRNRYIEIFKERTQDASDPLDILSCLTDTARILSPAKAIAAGLIHATAAPALPAKDEAGSWWITA